MKKILIALVLLALSACAQNAPITKANIDTAIAKCATSEGLRNLYYHRQTDTVNAYCNDGSFVSFEAK